MSMMMLLGCAAAASDAGSVAKLLIPRKVGPGLG